MSLPPHFWASDLLSFLAERVKSEESLLFSPAFTFSKLINVLMIPENRPMNPDGVLVIVDNTWRVCDGNS